MNKLLLLLLTLFLFLGATRKDTNDIIKKEIKLLALPGISFIGLESVETNLPYKPISEGTRLALINSDFTVTKNDIEGIEDNEGFVSIKEILYLYDIYCSQINIDPNILLAQIYAESRFNPNAISRTKATGLGQFTKGTWNSIMGTDLNDRFLIRESIKAHCLYINILLGESGGSWEHAMWRYLGSKKKSYTNNIFKTYLNYTADQKDS